MSLLLKSSIIVLALGLLCSHSADRIRSKSDASPPWFETEGFKEFHAQATDLYKANDYAGLEQLYRKAEQYARRVDHKQALITYLTALGNTYVVLYRYRDAIEKYAEGKKLAEESGNWESAGAITPGLVSVYFLVGDYDAARQASAEGVRAVQHQHSRPYYEAALKLQYAELTTGSGDPHPALDAIEAARAQHPIEESEAHRIADGIEAEATGWSILGETRIRSGDLAGAEIALAESLRLRRLVAPRNLCTSYLLLGVLRLAQAAQAHTKREGERRRVLLQEAERFTVLALQTASQTGRDLVAFRALHQRGVIRQKQGMPLEALQDFSAAAGMANRWRLAVPPADSSLTGANELLDREVFRDFAEAAAARAMETGDERWARESFLAAEENRAVSLRQTRELVRVWRERLPDRYWAALAQIRREEGEQLMAGHSASRSEPLHLELTKMEATFGFTGTNQEENFHSPNALNHLQQVLGESEVLLSIQAGKEQTYLWAVTQNSLRIYKLRGSDAIAEEIGRFRRAVLEQKAEAKQLGTSLYQSLFGQLSASESGKASWLLSLDGPFFELPFAALREAVPRSKRSAGEPEYLIERHALQIVPGAFLLGEQSAREATGNKVGRKTVTPSPLSGQSDGIGYVGFGDPVYNTADPRFRARPWYQQPWYGVWPSAKTAGQLNRLVASGDEVNRSAQAWRQSAGTSAGVRVFEGTAATREAFVGALPTLNAMQTAVVPSTIHLATHVLNGDTRRDQAFLAFSAGPSGSPELLATSDVARLNVHGSLVVMTGCASGTGDAVAGAGILGLTRAWLVAGAGGVISTGWAVEDTRSDLLPNFYRNLQKYTAAEALRRSQAEMLRAGNWQADPAYWASYQLTGVTR